MNEITQVAEENAATASRQYIRFHIGEHAFAFELGALQEIIRVPPIAHIPLSPPALKGLANYRGVVLPIIDLHHLLDVPHNSGSASTRVLVLDLDKPAGFIVDHISGIFAADPHQIEEDTREANIDSSYLAGLIRQDNTAVMLLSFNSILEKEFIAGDRQHAYQLSSNTFEATASAEIQDVRLVTFTAEDQEYAFYIEQVEEIIFLPKMLQIPNVESTVAGVIQLRERLLPVFHLRALLSLPHAQPTPENRIVIVSVQVEAEQRLVGLLVDSVKEILQLPHTNLGQVPQFFGYDSPNAEITAICRLSEEDRLISVLSSEAMFGVQKIQALLQGLQDKSRADAEMATATSHDEAQLVVFRLVDEELALPVDVVQEIVRVPELTKVPHAPDFIAGVFNYRGVVTPVVNQRRRLGLPSASDLESQRIMVLDVQGIKTGFMVDAITEVLRIPDTAFENPPDLFLSHMRMVNQIVHLGSDRMILMLDTEQLLNSVEFKALSKVAKKEKTR